MVGEQKAVKGLKSLKLRCLRIDGVIGFKVLMECLELRRWVDELAKEFGGTSELRIINKETTIRIKIIAGLILCALLSGCSTLKESLILGAGSGVAIGAIAGAQAPGDRGENSIKGAVLGGVALGLTSYIIHNSLTKRDEKTRRETLMNLQHYDVLGFEGISNKKNGYKNENCFSTERVDGKLVSIPCSLAGEGVNGQ